MRMSEGKVWEKGAEADNSWETNNIKKKKGSATSQVAPGCAFVLAYSAVCTLDPVTLAEVLCPWSWKYTFHLCFDDVTWLLLDGLPKHFWGTLSGEPPSGPCGRSRNTNCVYMYKSYQKNSVLIPKHFCIYTSQYSLFVGEFHIATLPWINKLLPYITCNYWNDYVN